MGVVFKARRLADGATVALKTVLPAIAPRPETLARFQREMAILQRLSHPNIVRFLDSGSSDGVLWFAMEYVEGVSAASHVKSRGPLPEAEVVELGVQLLDALAHAHLQGVVHRDVKPGNLLLTPGGGTPRLKLADFGLSRAYHESAMSGLTVMSTPGGTPGFMAPEQVTDFRSARPAADQFGAAATLYFLLTGEAVYERAANALDQFHQVLNLDPIPLRQPAPGPVLPGKLGDALRRALSRDPRRRFADVLAMRDALRAAAG
jgi:serine/threonine-protein kinase